MRILKLSNYLIIPIIILAGFFRFYKLNNVPPGPSLDEVSIGWNAYSILKTGKDEYGYQLPVLLRAYDDWRPALYVYLVIPFVKIFGLSAMTVRLPAVILSLSTILATFLLVKELFADSNLALISAFLLAISPWHIYLSRLGHEVGAGLTFSVWSVVFFLKWINFKFKFKYLILAMLAWAFSFYTYQSQKVFTPALILVIAVLFHKQLRKNYRQAVIAGLMGLLLLALLVKATLTPGGLARFTGASIFTNRPESYDWSVQRVIRDQQNGWQLARLIDSPKIAISAYALRSYLSHFDPVWLFSSRVEERHKIPSLGLFYLWELPLILVGFYQLVRKKYPWRNKILVITWLLIGPLPASLATQTPHGMRAFNMLPILPIIAALGLKACWQAVKLSKKIYLVAFLILAGSLAYVFHNYFFNFPYEQSDSFQSPIGEAVKYVVVNQDKYDKIIFSERGQLDQSYMFFLFFSQTDPNWYQKEGGTISGGFGQEHAFGKYEFRYIDWHQEMQKPATGKTLYVGNMLTKMPDLPEGGPGLKTIKLLDGRQAVKILAR